METINADQRWLAGAMRFACDDLGNVGRKIANRWDVCDEDNVARVGRIDLLQHAAGLRFKVHGPNHVYVLRHGQPRSKACLGGDCRERLRTRDDSNPGAGGEWLRFKELQGVNELVCVLSSYDTALAEHLIECLAWRVRWRNSVPSRDRVPRLASSDNDHGLLLRKPARNPRKLPGVANRLEVHSHGLGRVVFLPELHEVIARDIRAVSCRKES